MEKSSIDFKKFGVRTKFGDLIIVVAHDAQSNECTCMDEHFVQHVISRSLIVDSDATIDAAVIKAQHALNKQAAETILEEQARQARPRRTIHETAQPF